MLNIVAMFGIRMRPHRSLLILTAIICLLLIIIFYPKRRSSSIEKIKINNDENINLVDLFNHAFKLTYEAGQTIKLIKNTKKKSFENLPNEPVTIADLISHSIINNGLKKLIYKSSSMFRGVPRVGRVGRNAPPAFEIYYTNAPLLLNSVSEYFYTFTLFSKFVEYKIFSVENFCEKSNQKIKKYYQKIFSYDVG